MTVPGRNDPCSCGSGLKYKKCCLGKEASASPEVFTEAERKSALDRLFRFSGRTEFEPAHSAAHAEFWAGWTAQRSEDEVNEAMRLQQSDTATLEWFVFDFLLTSGRTVTEEFLD